jgi:4'-phosphopantetheinyl transferase
MLRFVTMEMLEKITIGTTIVAAGLHEGKYEMDEDLLHPDEITIVKELSPRKRSEWLASRDLLFQIASLPVRPKCLYDDFGKPYLEGIPKHISVSHSELWCAAMISDQPCGVDIQVYSETVRRIADRFLTPDDLLSIGLAENPLQQLHLLWGAKECIYKAYGRRKLGFREHIFITSINHETGLGSGEINFEGIHLYYDIYFKMLPEVAWVFCIERVSPLHPTG